MDWQYLVDASAFQIVLGFVIAKLFEQLSERRQDRRLAIQLNAERERLQLQQQGELAKRLFDAKFDAALRLTRMLKSSVQTLRSQTLLHAAVYSTTRADVENFRHVRDSAFESAQAAFRDGADAAAIMDFLFHDLSFKDFPHQRPLVQLTMAWQAFVRQQEAHLGWLEKNAADLPSALDEATLEEREAEVSRRTEDMRVKASTLVTLVDEYDASVSESIRILATAIRQHPDGSSQKRAG